MDRNSIGGGQGVDAWPSTMGQNTHGCCSFSTVCPITAGKVRPIDDLSRSQVNSTVNTCEQATVDGPGVICSYATYLVRCLEEQGFSTCLRGRSLDLTSACGQLAIADESLQRSYLSVYDPSSGSEKLLHQVALPFLVQICCNRIYKVCQVFYSGLLLVFSFFLDLLL